MDEMMHLPRGARTYADLMDGFRWEVPRQFNIAEAVCGRHARRRELFALYFEDEDGTRQSYSFWDIQREANRLANALRALGVGPGDRVAIILPQRPETAIAHVACYQMGAMALPLSHLFGPDALAFRLEDAAAVAAIVDPDTMHALETARDGLTHLRHVIGVAGARNEWIQPWENLLARAASEFTPVETLADDPAMIIYTSGTTGSPKGAVIPHRTLIGNLPGFCCSHDFFPEQGDMFWSPADWAWTGGLFDALLPTWFFGQPQLAYRGRFDPEKACWLMARYGVRNAFLFPTALKMIMKHIQAPRERHDLRLRTLMSGGEAVGETVMHWASEQLGVTINEIFGQTEMNYVIGGCARAFQPRPGAVGRPYPGHRIALLDDAGEIVPDGQLGEICVHRDGDPVMFLGYLNRPEDTAAKYTGAWARTGDLAVRDEDGYYWYRGRTDDVIKSAGYRIGPSEIENCLLRHPAVANVAVIGVHDDTRGQVIKAVIVPVPGTLPSEELERQLQDHVRARLAPYQCPKLFEFTEVLPMTTSGKIQRRMLRRND